MGRLRRVSALLVLALLAACSGTTASSDASATTDTGSNDAGPADRGCGDTMTDSRNCGGCGRVCCTGSRCVGGACVLGCPAGNAACPPSTPPVGCFGGGVCRDLQTDNEHCGACGNACPAGELCVFGACQAPVTDAAVDVVDAPVVE